MNTAGKLIVSLAVLCAVAVTSQAGIVIYNDMAGTQGGGDAGEAATMNKIQGNLSGALIDYVTGAPTGITYTGMTGAAQGITATNTPGPGDATDFGKVFNGILNQLGVYYTSSFHFTLSGLDPAKQYELVIADNRPSSNNWHNIFRLDDVASFTNTSSPGTTIATTVMANDTTTILNSNEIAGYVVRFTNINPGPDGDFTIYQSCVDPPAGPTPVAYINGFRLTEVPEPATMALLGMGGLALLRRRSK